MLQFDKKRGVLMTVYIFVVKQSSKPTKPGYD